MNDYIVLFQFVRLSKGKTRSLLISYHENKIYPISNDIIELLNAFKVKKIKDVINENEVHEESILKFIDFLIENGLAFYCSDPSRFIDIPDDYLTYSQIENAIVKIKFNSNTLNDYRSIISQLNDLGTEFIEIRFLGKNINLKIDNFLSLFEYSNFMGIEMYLEYNNEISENFLNDLCIKYQRLTNVFVYNSPENKLISKRHVLYNEMGNMFFITDSIENCNCGKISMKSMHLGKLTNYFLSKKHNSCLFGKISIDENGNIKNCPSMKESFGNVRDISLAEVIEKPEFKKYWNINKDKIHVCKDCEFRHICTDCRAYVEDPKDIFSKPLKCGYNPYIGEWSEWSANPLKQKAIDFYDMREMVNEIDSKMKAKTD